MSGNILKESSPQGITCFQYNTLNQQTKVIMHRGDTLINHYDAEGLSAEIEENEKLTKFIFHGDEIAVETDEQDQVVSRLIHGHDFLVADVNNEKHYYQQDEQFSTKLYHKQHRKSRKLLYL